MEKQNIPLSLALFLLKVLGGFPFRRCVKKACVSPTIPLQLPGAEQRSSATEEGRPHPPKHGVWGYERSRGWRLWSCWMAVTVLCYLVDTLIKLPFPLEVPATKQSTFIVAHKARNFIVTKQSTLIVAHKTRNIIMCFTVVSLMVYLLRKSSLALKTVSKLQTLTVDAQVSPGKCSHTVYVSLSSALVLAGYGCIIVIHIARFIVEPTVSTISDMYELTLYLLISSFIMTFYYWVIYLMCDVYDGIKSSLSRLHGTHHPEPHNDSTNDDLFETNCVCESHGPTVLRRTSLEILPQNQAEPSQKQVLIKGVGNKLMQIHEFHRILNDYIGLPITLMILSSVVYSIVACYYLSFWWQLGLGRQILVLGYTVVSILPLLVLTNIPAILLTQTDEARLVLRTLRRREEDRQLKHELEELLELLDESPGFELCRLFILDRRRMVDIFSFVATYLIILLQFRMTDTVNTASANGTDRSDNS